MDLQEKIKTFPQSPGIYLMKDSLGNIIYIGKSKNLRSRVRSYFQPSRQVTRKIEKLVFNIKDIDFIQTDTEFEALLLECQYIQKLKPHYNSLMKNPKRYCYIVLTQTEKWPRLQIVHTLENDRDLYFGPFTNKNTVETALQGLKDFFKIDCLFFPQQKGPCLNYSLGQCIGICAGKNYQEYLAIFEQIIDLFSHKSGSCLVAMEELMKSYARNYAFEKAARYRNYLQSCHSLLKQENAIDFIKGAGLIAMFEPLNENTVKFFLLQGNRILIRKKIVHTNKRELEKAILDTAHAIQKEKNTSHPSTMITKEEIDTTQIIYNYLQNGNCHYFRVEKSWLEKEKTSHLVRKMTEIIQILTQH